MKYYLETAKVNGRKVFVRNGNGRYAPYFIYDENGNCHGVHKEDILQNADSIVNLGISGDKIYPVGNLTKADFLKGNNKATLQEILTELQWLEAHNKNYNNTQYQKISDLVDSVKGMLSK